MTRPRDLVARAERWLTRNASWRFDRYRTAQEREAAFLILGLHEANRDLRRALTEARGGGDEKVISFVERVETKRK